MSVSFPALSQEGRFRETNTTIPEGYAHHTSSTTFESISVRISPKLSRQSAGLQAADYFLWSLQRLFERGEDRFVKLLQPRISVVHDVDDTTDAPYGVYYSKKRPLDATVGRWQKKKGM